MTDSRNPLPGSSNYIQNSTVVQPSSDFNISGEGKASIFSATTQHNMGWRVLAITGANNLFVGIGTGTANTTGNGNSFVGSSAGVSNTIEAPQLLFGSGAGFSNTAATEMCSAMGEGAGISTRPPTATLSSEPTPTYNLRPETATHSSAPVRDFRRRSVH
ncbi:MAG: hypothetical protein IPJ30_16505 [Acidobacteria bacterium]|nr:hypothetical protein [Acidobacteriota bacterium]